MTHKDQGVRLAKIRELVGRPDPVAFTRELIAPAARVYVGRDDRLYLRSRNSASSVVLELAGRWQQPDGSIVPFRFAHTPNTDRTVALTSQRLGEGYLLSLVAFASAGAVRRGQCYVELGIIRGLEAAAGVAQVLAADYVTTAAAIGWPGTGVRSSLEGRGILRSVATADPAAGAEISQTVPTDARWKLLSFIASLVTDATAVTRYPILIIDDGTDPLWDAYEATGEAASSTQFYLAGETGFAPVVNSTITYLPLPIGYQLLQAYRIRTSTTNIQAADNWSAAQLSVEEWIED